MNTTDITTCLIDLAHTRARIQSQLDDLEAQRIAIVTQIAALKQELDAAEQEAIATVEAHYRDTGEKLDGVKYAHGYEWAYDEKETLKEAIARDDKKLVRVKVTKELDKRELKRLLNMGMVTWVQAEKVPVVRVTIGPIGELLLMEGVNGA